MAEWAKTLMDKHGTKTQPSNLNAITQTGDKYGTLQNKSVIYVTLLPTSLLQ